jgi:hypothetical protein
MENNELKSNIKTWNVDADYAKIVTEAYRNNQDFIIENSDIDHAKFLSYLLLNKAKNKVRIFTGKLRELFYSDERIKEAIQETANKGKRIDIVIESNEPECKEFLSFVKDNENIHVFKLNSVTDIKNHFILIDETAFRIEAPHTKKQLDGNKVKGLANFNDPIFAKKLVDIFDNSLMRNITAKKERFIYY